MGESVAPKDRRQKNQEYEHGEKRNPGENVDSRKKIIL